MCNIHIKDYYSKYFVFNYSNFILFHCDFTLNLLYDITSADAIFRFWVTPQKTLAVYWRECRVSKNVLIHVFWILINICFKHWIVLIYALICWIKICFSVSTLSIYFLKTLANPLKFQIIFIMLHFCFIHISV